MHTARVSIFAVTLASACAEGSGGRGDDTETEGDELGSSDVTDDTIDPTMFGTSSPTTGPSTSSPSTSDPTEDTVDTTAIGDTTDEPTTTTSGTGDGPTVIEVSPADDSAGIAASTAIGVRFSAAMDPVSIAGDDGSCTAAVQLSRDDFATCVPLSSVAIASEGDTYFELLPEDALPSAATLRVRVTTDAAAQDGTPLAATFESEGFRVRYFHTIEIDGNDDWNGDETFATSTAGHTAYTAWDDEYVYLAMRSPDVAAANGEVWVFAYFGGDAGTTEGVLYNTQQPTLPFAAQWHLRWRADNVLTEALAFDGAAWSSGWAIGDGDVYQQGELVELRVARSVIGDPEALELHMGILRETDLGEASWAAHPEGSYVDGYNPSYGEFWSFDLSGSDTPAQHLPM